MANGSISEDGLFSSQIPIRGDEFPIRRSAALHSQEHLDDVQDLRDARRDWRSPGRPRPRARERNERRLSAPRRCAGVHAPHTNRRIIKGGQGIHIQRVQRMFFNGTNRVILLWASGVFTFGLTIDGTMFFPITQDMVLVIMQGRWQCIDSNRSVVEDLLKPGTTKLSFRIPLSEARRRNFRRR
jgi:hypothetical protein